MNEVCELLEKLQNKGICYHTQMQAYSIMLKLKKLLTQLEYVELDISWIHAFKDEGPAEFNSIIDKLKKKYQNL